MKYLVNTITKAGQISKLIFKFEETDITVEVIHTTNKNIYLTLKDQQIILKKPQQVPQEVAIQFVEKHLSKFVDKKESKTMNKKLWDLDAGWYYLWGYKKNFYVKVEKSKNFLISNDFKIAIFNLEKETIEIALKKYLTKLLLVKATELTLQIEEKMATISHKVMIQEKKSRWGINYLAKKQIAYNLKLIHFDNKFLHYLVIHEVAHSLEPNHSPNFWNIVTRFCPDWKTIRHKLNRNEVF